jgi:predicted pyridoxine 5'-phosphate oxidase superfamily flavin-nucleotide-binding protein
MSRAYAELAFSPTVREMQTRQGSRHAYARLDSLDDRQQELTDVEAEFIGRSDGFFQASVSETGWPYVQFRGGPAGFLHVLDNHTLAYADMRGNRQYISAGNLQVDPRAALILVDQARQQRLKIMGTVRLIELADAGADGAAQELIERLSSLQTDGKVERAVLIDVAAWDWNCLRHITPRYTEAEIAAAVAPLHEQIAALKAQLAQAKAASR